MRLGGISVTRLLTELAVAGSTPGNDLGQVVYAHVPLSPSSIIWYRRKLGSKRPALRYTDPVSRTLGFVQLLAQDHGKGDERLPVFRMERDGTLLYLVFTVLIW